jgi:hypothetical protein
VRYSVDPLKERPLDRIRPGRMISRSELASSFPSDGASCSVAKAESLVHRWRLCFFQRIANQPQSRIELSGVRAAFSGSLQPDDDLIRPNLAPASVGAFVFLRAGLGDAGL